MGAPQEYETHSSQATDTYMPSRAKAKGVGI